MKFDLSQLKSNNGNNKQNFSNSLNGINNLNNINMNKLKNIQFNSTTNNNMNFSYMSNNINLSPCNSNMSNMSITSRKNNFFNHKKLLIATLNKKIKSPQPNKEEQFEKLKNIAIQMVSKAQNFIRDTTDASSVSLREIRKFLIFYKFFYEYLKFKKENYTELELQKETEFNYKY